MIGHPKNFYNLGIRCCRSEGSSENAYTKEEERQIIELDFGNTPEILKGEYLDMYEGIQSETIKHY